MGTFSDRFTIGEDDGSYDPVLIDSSGNLAKVSSDGSIETSGLSKVGDGVTIIWDDPDGIVLPEAGSYVRIPFSGVNDVDNGAGINWYFYATDWQATPGKNVWFWHGTPGTAGVMTPEGQGVGNTDTSDTFEVDPDGFLSMKHRGFYAITHMVLSVRNTHSQAQPIRFSPSADVSGQSFRDNETSRGMTGVMADMQIAANTTVDLEWFSPKQPTLPGGCSWNSYVMPFPLMWSTPYVAAPSWAQNWSWNVQVAGGSGLIRGFGMSVMRIA